MSLSQETMMGVYPSTSTIPCLSPKNQSFATFMLKWTQDFAALSILNPHGCNGRRNGKGSVLLLPDPLDNLRNCLGKLEEQAKRHYATFMAARRIATKHEIKWMEAKRKHSLADYQLALRDGRLQVVKPKEPNLKPEPPLTNKDIARKALAKLGEQERAKILAEFMP